MKHKIHLRMSTTCGICGTLTEAENITTDKKKVTCKLCQKIFNSNKYYQ